MAGRWKLVLCGGLVAGAAGCNRQETVPGPFAMPPQPTSSPSFFSKTPGPPPTPEPVASERKGPPSADTLAAFADAQTEAAFMDGRPAVERDHLLDAARQQYQKALDTDPKNKAALTGLANLYAKGGDRERAVAVLRTTIQHHPKDHQLAHRMAAVQARFGDWQGASESCRQALAVDPENRSYHKTLGYCQAQLGRWDEAFGSLMRVMPEAQARYFLGRVLIDLQRFDDAKEQMQLALQLDPQNQVAKQVLTDIEAGRVVVPKAEQVQQAGFHQ